MKDEIAKHEIDKIKEYEQKGYKSSYQMIDGKFTELENESTFKAEEIMIIDEYRYEGQSNPEDMSMLYVIEVANKSKGTLLIPYGPSADGELAWFMKEVSQNSLNSDKTSLGKI